MEHKGSHFSRAIEESHEIDMATQYDGGYVSEHIRAMAIRYELMLSLGYDPDMLAEVYKDAA